MYQALYVKTQELLSWQGEDAKSMIKSLIYCDQCVLEETYFTEVSLPISNYYSSMQS